MLLYQFDAAVSRGFYIHGAFSKREEVSGFRVQGSGFRVQGSGFRVQGSGLRRQLRCNIYGAMPEGKWIAGFPFGISNH